MKLKCEVGSCGKRHLMVKFCNAGTKVAVKIRGGKELVSSFLPINDNMMVDAEIEVEDNTTIRVNEYVGVRLGGKFYMVPGEDVC